jgi:hypothetical protein
LGEKKRRGKGRNGVRTPSITLCKYMYILDIFCPLSYKCIKVLIIMKIIRGLTPDTRTLHNEAVRDRRRSPPGTAAPQFTVRPGPQRHSSQFTVQGPPGRGDRRGPRRHSPRHSSQSAPGIACINFSDTLIKKFSTANHGTITVFRYPTP